ncbi:hypothetical protein HK099_007499 [Clydaea vesicula]|uniref:Uncharacterized protein n=1 Tax=Clydaea vesicula TaxID=447962 RepID=A0AAD5U179_9FUNG|nr:hypothetical protein HK099_007499 [Clydaea vesicula]
MLEFKFLFNKKFIDEVLDVLYDEVTTREQKLDEMDELREDSFPEIYEQYSYLELLRIGGFKLDHENFLSELDEVFRNFDVIADDKTKERRAEERKKYEKAYFK